MQEVRKVQQYSRQLVVGLPRRLVRSLGIVRGDWFIVRSTAQHTLEFIPLGPEATKRDKRLLPRGRRHSAA
jgi:hypothetical protein